MGVEKIEEIVNILPKACNTFHSTTTKNISKLDEK